MTEHDERTDEQQLDPATKAWLDKNKWFEKDPTLRGAAIVEEQALIAQGVPASPARNRLVEQAVKSRYSDKFDEGELETKPTWEDIPDVEARRDARASFRELKEEMPSLTEEKYLKEYFNG